MTRLPPRLIAVAILITACSVSISAQPETVDELRAKAEQGDAAAQYNLGLMYRDGHGVTHHYKEAFRWFRKAAMQGDIMAQGNLGNMYRRGQGVPQDHAEAVRWYRTAAVRGQALSQAILAVMYANGLTSLIYNITRADCIPFIRHIIR